MDARDADGTGRGLVVVAHPDDEALWAGGLMLARPRWDWAVLALCRASDPDRAPKFRRALERLKATGNMADLDDGPQQAPLAPELVERTVLSMLPGGEFDLALTHGPLGEYTRHRRHEEASRAVGELWRRGEMPSRELWLFAYEDGGGAYLPRAVEDADRVEDLPPEVWCAKRRIITEVYGFAPESFEARATPRREAFRRFGTPQQYADWLGRQGEAGR